MGLDQSIFTRIYKSQFSNFQQNLTYEQMEELSKLNYKNFCKVAELMDFEDLVDLSDPECSYSATLELELIYLRKCYPIHYWIYSRFSNNQFSNFSDNQPSTDLFSGQIYLTQESLKSLKESCDIVLSDNSKAEEIFPNQSILIHDYDDVFFGKISYLSKRLAEIMLSPKFKYLHFYYSYSM